MDLMVWNDSFSVGDALMDAHHQVFFQMVTEVREAARGVDAPAEAQRVAFLLEYTRMHFAKEEQLMETCGFPGLEAHRRTHQDFAAQAGSLAAALAEAPASVTTDHILSVMQAWLVDHILGMDKQFEPWVARHKAS